MKTTRILLTTALFIGIPASMQAMDVPIIPHKPIGLKNKGNTCFMNASIQVLYAMSQQTAFLNEQHTSPYKPGSLAEAYFDLIPQIMHADEQAASPGISPKVVCKRAWKMPSFKKGDQADANEFLLNLLSCLSHQDVKESPNSLDPNDKQMEHKTPFGRMHTLHNLSTLYHEASAYMEKPRKEPAHCLSLKVKEGSKTLQDCLDKYFDPNDIDNKEQIPTYKLEEPDKFLNENGIVDGRRYKFIEETSNYLIKLMPNKALSRVNSVFWVSNCLSLCQYTHEALTILSKCNDRWGSILAFFVRDDLR